jgi:MJ1316 RNA cyclic group end recognition domain
MPMTLWVSETSDEDFIPQHRIKYFKRNSDGEVVWDREGRIDKIFGTGLTGRKIEESKTKQGDPH